MIDLILDDCMIVMKDYEDNHFDLAITDPPYGEECDINSNGNRTATRNGFSDLYLNHTSGKWNVAPKKEYFDELFRVSKKQIIWGGNFFDLPPTPSLIVWNKMQRNFSFGDGELAWCSIGKSMRIFDMSRGEMQKEQRIHITQKPVKLYSWILDKYAKKGQKILDTHLGSGSIAIACHYFGVDLVGVEIDKEYYDKAKKRVDLLTKQESLF